jgi:hypothetical protein
VVLPPPYQQPPGAEFPAMGFSVELKILVKAMTSFRAWFSPPTEMEPPSGPIKPGNFALPFCAIPACLRSTG